MIQIFFKQNPFIIIITVTAALLMAAAGWNISETTNHFDHRVYEWNANHGIPLLTVTLQLCLSKYRFVGYQPKQQIHARQNLKVEMWLVAEPMMGRLLKKSTNIKEEISTNFTAISTNP